MPTLDFKHIAILLAYAVLTAVLNLIFSKRSQIDEWCEANPKLAAFAKLLRGIGIDPWTIFQSATLAFTKKLPDYQKQSLGELKASKKPSVPPLGILVLLVCFAAGTATGCALFSPKGPIWPIVAKCLPSTSVLLTQVENILLAGGAFESALLSLANTLGKDGLDLVVCAVRALADKWSQPGLSASEAAQIAPALMRAKAFLAETGNL